MSLPDAPWAQDPGKKEAILTFCSNEVWRSVLTSLAQMHQKKKKKKVLKYIQMYLKLFLLKNY